MTTGSLKRLGRKYFEGDRKEGKEGERGWTAAGEKKEEPFRLGCRVRGSEESGF